MLLDQLDSYREKKEEKNFDLNFTKYIKINLNGSQI